MLGIIQKIQLEFNKDKSVVDAKERKYSGHVICCERSRPDLKKIQGLTHI